MAGRKNKIRQDFGTDVCVECEAIFLKARHVQFFCCRDHKDEWWNKESARRYGGHPPRLPSRVQQSLKLTG